MPFATALSSRQSAEKSPRQLRAVPMSQLRSPGAPPVTLRLPRLVDEAAAPAGSAPERTSAPEPDAPPRGKATISPASRHAHLLQDVVRCLLFHLDASVGHNRKATRVPASMAPSLRPLLTSSPVFLQWPVPAINVHGPACTYVTSQASGVLRIHRVSIAPQCSLPCQTIIPTTLVQFPGPDDTVPEGGNPECGVNSGTASAAAGHCSIVYLRAVSQYLPPTSSPLTRATALANRSNPTSY